MTSTVSALVAALAAGLLMACAAPAQAPASAPEPVMCSMIYQPVCGVDGKTYPNACHAKRAGVKVAHEGQC